MDDISFSRFEEFSSVLLMKIDVLYAFAMVSPSSLPITVV